MTKQVTHPMAKCPEFGSPQCRSDSIPEVTLERLVELCQAVQHRVGKPATVEHPEHRPQLVFRMERQPVVDALEVRTRPEEMAELAVGVVRQAIEEGDPLVARNVMALGEDGEMIWRVPNHGIRNLVGNKLEAFFGIYLGDKGRLWAVTPSAELRLDPETGEYLDMKQAF